MLLLCLCFLLMISLMTLSIILPPMPTMRPSSVSVIRLLICGNSYSWRRNLNQTYGTLCTWVRSCFLVSVLGKLSLFQIALVLLIWKCIGLSLIGFVKFLLSEIWSKATIWPCIEYCCHSWAGVPKCYVNMLDKLHKQICKLLVETTILSLFYGFYVWSFSSELGKLVPSPYSRGKSGILIERTIFLLLTLDGMRMPMWIMSSS